jgi:hypothetical protein
MSMHDLFKKAGKVEVNLAPLLVIVGAAMSTPNMSLAMEDVVELLTGPEGTDGGD